MTEEDKRMYDDHKEHGEDMSYENEGGTVTIPLKEYDLIIFTLSVKAKCCTFFKIF